MSNTVINPYNFVVGNVGAWKEVGRTILGSSGDTISVTGIPDKMYYMMLGSYLPSGNFRTTYRINNDSGSNYALRKSEDGGAENVTTSITDMTVGNEDTDTAYFDVSYLYNLSANEKLMINNNMRTGGGGAGSVPKRVEAVAKWDNTSSVINRIDAINDQGGDFASGSECVVLGYDPTDTHTEVDNFWQELASDTLTGTASQLDSGTFTAKKYLWCQIYAKGAGSIQPSIEFNNDTGSNYATRYSSNGSADGEDPNATSILNNTNDGSENSFINFFVINNSANEKLMISHEVSQQAAGAAATPSRNQAVGKWDNTSSQITRITTKNIGTYAIGSSIKVWGSN